MQRQRDKRAVKKFFRKLLIGLTYVPRVIVSDKLKSYAAAKREILLGGNIASSGIAIIAENSPQPTRQREQHMPRFKSPGDAQRFLSAYAPISQHFRARRYRFAAPAYRQELRTRFRVWQETTTPVLAG